MERPYVQRLGESSCDMIAFVLFSVSFDHRSLIDRYLSILVYTASPSTMNPHAVRPWRLDPASCSYRPSLSSCRLRVCATRVVRQFIQDLIRSSFSTSSDILNGPRVLPSDGVQDEVRPLGAGNMACEEGFLRAGG